jgi:flagellar biosynthesis anti-sigma factor FlgM
MSDIMRRTAEGVTNVKIDGNMSDLLHQGLDRVGGATVQAGNRTAPNAAPATATTDAVTLSDDAQLMRTAMEAARQAPDIRPDVVARMRAALNNGEIGQDAGKLADSIINSWTGEK